MVGSVNILFTPERFIVLFLIRKGRYDLAYTRSPVFAQIVLEKGLCNLQACIRIAKQYGIPVVVAVNRFTTDTGALPKRPPVSRSSL